MVKSKTHLNKFVTGAATAAMVATAVVPVASAAGFTDIGKISSSVQAEINEAVDLGFFKDATTFNPSVKITRGQAALTLARYIAGDATVKEFVAAHDLESKVIPFADVPTTYKNGKEFEQELYYASLVVKNAGAFTQNKLNPIGNVTRTQMAKIITETFELEKVEGFNSKISDVAHLDAVTKEYIETIASHNVTNVSKFMPAGHVTRSQMASFLVRSNNAVDVDEEVVISSIKDIQDITVTAGEEVILPKKVGVVYSDDLTADLDVKWDTKSVDFGVAGTYNITGAIEGTDLTATVKVVVEELMPAVTSVKVVTSKDKNSTVTATVIKPEKDATAIITVTPDASLKLDDIVIKNVKIDNDGKISIILGELPKGTHTVKVTVGELSETTKFTVDYTAMDAAVAAVNASSTQIQLWNALQNDLFEGVAVQSNLVDYSSALSSNYKTVAEIITAVKAINGGLDFESTFKSVEKALNEAYPNQLSINNVLNKNFKDVQADNVGKYVLAMFNNENENNKYKVSLTSMVEIQSAIYLVNAQEAVSAAKVASSTLDSLGNATQAAINSAQTLHDQASILVKGLDTADTTLASGLALAQVEIDAAKKALDEMNEAITAGQSALAMHKKAGGVTTDAKYIALAAELNKTTKDKESLTTATTNLTNETKKLTAVADAKAAQLAFKAAGGNVEGNLNKAVDSQLALNPVVIEDLMEATKKLEEQTAKFVLYAGVLAAKTPSDMRALLFNFGNDDYLNLSSAQKTEFAGWFIEELVAKSTVPNNHIELKAFFELKLTAYEALISAINSAENNVETTTALKALGNKAFEALNNIEKSNVADKVLENRPTSGYITLASIVTAMEL